MNTFQPKPQPPKKKRDYKVAAIVVIVVLAAAAGIAQVIKGESTPRKRVMDTVALKLVPPPPPPPPKEPPPPPPPKMVEKPKIEPPQDKPEAPKPVDAPPPGPLALDAKGGAGSDSFGLGGKPGGADYGGGGGTRYGHYSVLMQTQLKRALAEYQKLTGVKYQGTVRLHLTPSGGIVSVEVLRINSDNSDAGGLVEQAIKTMASFSEAPPAEMPTTVVLKLNSSGGGA